MQEKFIGDIIILTNLKIIYIEYNHYSHQPNLLLLQTNTNFIYYIPNKFIY